MKIIDGIKEIGQPFKIPNSSRDDLPQFFKELGFKVGAEIGVYLGEFTEKFCQVGLNIYAVDPWISYLGSGRSETVQSKQIRNYIEAKRKLAHYKNCKIIKKTSMDALLDFKDESLDFVYIDGDHRFRYIAEDIYEWEKKVKKGGVVSGHDYFFTNPKATNVVIHVGPVVDAFIKVKGIKNFYTIGTNNPPGNNRGDKVLSWMFFKK